jgi:colicin import membrane protein
MPRKLKTYQASLGFFDLAVAAPSMKAALEAWGSKTNHFHQGFAKESDDPEIIAATMAKPGVVLRRAVGSNGSFSEHAVLPKNLTSGNVKPPGKRAPNPQQPPDKIDEKTARKAAIAYARDQKRRDRERLREEAAQESERKRREQAIAKADAELEAARQAHDIKTEEIAAARAALDRQSDAEEMRWGKQKAKLEAAQSRARE